MSTSTQKNETSSATKRPTPLAMPPKRIEHKVTPLSAEAQAELAQLEK